ncbi:MAG: hypothetical protein BRC44_15290 [Cyanobacteria bacterium QS_4_48_99]|nr:MAG: hypothetical protein BRC44_15290 [Cyanobacteria bacterium QS_4_48_99]
MESIDISQPNPTDSLVPNAGQQGDTSSNNPLQLASPESNHSASGEASSISDDAALNAATWFAEEQLDSFASDEDFLSNMEQAFGDNWQPQQAEDLIQNLASGDAMPKVEVIPGSDLKANGGFGEDTIYLSEEFLSSAKSEQLSGGLIEEIGHFVDQELNSGDSPGDEGDIFQQLVEDKAISDGELVDLKAEDDSRTIALGGEKFSVETATYGFKSSIVAKDISDDQAKYYSTPGVPPVDPDYEDEPILRVDGQKFDLWKDKDGMKDGEEGNPITTRSVNAEVNGSTTFITLREYDGSDNPELVGLGSIYNNPGETGPPVGYPNNPERNLKTLKLGEDDGDDDGNDVVYIISYNITNEVPDNLGVIW